MRERPFETSLQGLIEEQVRRRPDGAAVRFEGAELSAAELDERANRCAHYLRELGVGPDHVVAVTMERSLESVVAFLAVLKAGGAYLPVDPDWPRARRDFVLDDAGVSVVLTQARFEERLRHVDGTVVALDRDWSWISERPAGAPPSITSPGDLAYVIYTSGSTGRPKGCTIPHRAICNRLLWMRRQYGVSDRDRILQKTPFTFDVSVWELFLPLLSGACMVMARPEGHRDNGYLVELIARERISICHFVPSMLRFFLGQPRVRSCDGSLAQVFVSGEALDLELLRRFRGTLSARLHNLYGPTEAAVDVSFWECEERADGKVPIGRPIDNVELHVLDPELRPLPPGEAGELYIGGIALARGYLDRPELTRERFVSDPFSAVPGARLYRTGDRATLLADGNLEFLGRLDFQVKVRGVRVEPEEIESVLRSHEAIDDAVVLVRDEESSDPLLVAYVTAGAGVSRQELRAFAAARLPESMVPNRIVTLDAMPVTAHGKVDRAALPWPPAGEAEPPPSVRSGPLDRSGPVDDVRKLVAETMRCGDVAPTADLFDLGATSFTLVRIAERVAERYGVVLPVDLLLAAPTAAAIAACVARTAPDGAGSAAAAGPPSGRTTRGPLWGGMHTAPRVHSAPAVELPAVELRASAFLDPRAVGAFAREPIAAADLGRFLSLLVGARVGEGTKYLYASAGGLNAVQTYVHLRPQAVEGLAEGLYYHHPLEHRLICVEQRPRLDAELLREADRALFDGYGLALFLVAALDAIEPVYGRLALPLTALEAGYMGQLLSSRQREVPLRVVPVAGVDGDRVLAQLRLGDRHLFLHCLLAGVPAGRRACLPPCGSSVRRGSGPSAFSSPSASARELLEQVSQGASAAGPHDDADRRQPQIRRGTESAAGIPLSLHPLGPARHRARSCKREYLDAPVPLAAVARFLALLRPATADGEAPRLYASALAPRGLDVYLYAKQDGVDGLAAGVYRYEPAAHRLLPTAAGLSRSFESCFTPFNRTQARACRFALFLVAPSTLLDGPDPGGMRHLALLEAGAIGQLLLDRQAELQIGACPIGALTFDEIRADFGLQEGDELVHSFVCGGFEVALPRDWERLEVAGTVGRAAGSAAPPSGLAIVGMSARFPGAEDLEAFARNLRDGRASFTTLNFDDADGYRRGAPQGRDATGAPAAAEHDGAGREEGRRHRGGFLDGVDRFDAALFGIPPVEARAMDPQERLLLEVVWECLERSGYTAAELARVSPRVGVFVGAMWGDYQHYGSGVWRQATTAVPGSLHSLLANRISHVFDFDGPSVAVDTSCASALSAIHYAARAIEDGECRAAVVGAVNLMSHPYHQGYLRGEGLLSADGNSRPFAAEASGWVAGEGVAAILLKPLADAERDGDRVLGVIRGTWIGHGGRTSRYGAPSPQRQGASMLAACARAGVEPASISYVEAAAPGASLADAAEAAALAEVIGDRGAPEARRFVGSVKGNVGHLEAASGMSQLAKVLLQLEQQTIFPTLGSEPRSPLVGLSGPGLRIATELTPWPAPRMHSSPEGPRRALINAFGATGAAAHLVVDEAPARPAPGEDRQALVLLSAGSEPQLRQLAARLDAVLRRASPAPRLVDVAHTLRMGRVEMEHRLALVAGSHRELLETLAAFASGAAAAGLVVGRAAAGDPGPPRDPSGIDPHTLAARWVSGERFAWGVLGRGDERRVVLPTYPFAEERHWIEPATAAAESEAHEDQRRVRETAEVDGAPRARRDAIEAHLLRVFAAITEIPRERIDATASFEALGLSSRLIHRITAELEESFGALPKTLLFEHRTLRELAGHLIDRHPELGSPAASASLAGAPAAPAALSPPGPQRQRREAAWSLDGEPVAVIGMSGRYPRSPTLAAFWENLRDGVDCITEVPADRWDPEAYARPGKPAARWGGFLPDVDQFDPLFFNISPREAERMDPQERLFLETAWHAVEDAGYNVRGLAECCAGRVGVFVGVMYGEYQLFGALAPGVGAVATRSWYGSIANRVSYVLDLHGPSMAVDSMCSSSLTALHLAVESIRRGESAAAIAGGVNLSLHPAKYVMLGQLEMLSSDGRCRSFGAGGDGMVPGEGVGAVLLKPLSRALADGDHVYGVIRATAINHDGRTHGYTVPNPNAQGEMIVEALRRAQLDPSWVSYVEAHGTGTALGDPVEIAGLMRAFGLRATGPSGEGWVPGSCALGSVKASIGHLEAAAGIAGLTKVLLQMEHRQLVPSLHSAPPNPDLDLSAGPFHVQQELAPWPRPTVGGEGERREVPRIACISSFGAGGANAHAVVEEHLPPAAADVAAAPASAPVLVVLSAASEGQLRTIAENLGRFVAQHSPSLPELAYTLQVGREALAERLALLVADRDELTAKLAAFAAGSKEIVGAWRGRGDAKRARALDDEDARSLVDGWLREGRLEKIARWWVEGGDVRWPQGVGRRLRLPTYPFARERYWPPARPSSRAQPGVVPTTALHPLLHRNTSRLGELRFTSVFDGSERFLAQHRLELSPQRPGGDSVLPAAACLEMVRAAVEEATGWRGAMRLEGVVWERPLVVGEQGAEVHLALSRLDGDRVRFEIYTEAEQVPVRHCVGSAAPIAGPRPAALDLPALRAAMTRPGATREERERLLAAAGMHYGPAFRSLEEIVGGDGAPAQALARLTLPAAAGADDRLVLHPSMLDGALQASVALFAPQVPVALERMEVFGATTEAMWAWVRACGPGRLDLDLCDDEGRVCVRIEGLSFRPLQRSQAATHGTLICRPIWVASEAEAAAPAVGPHSSSPQGPRRLVVLVGREIPQGRGDVRWVAVEDRGERPEELFIEVVERTHEVVRAELERKDARPTLLQLVTARQGAGRYLAGVSGLLRSAHQENPRFRGQLVELGPEAAASLDLLRVLDDEAARPWQDHVRYERGERLVARWEEVAVGHEPVSPPPFREDGVYLITGGAGRLGLAVAGEIARRRPGAAVVLAGRSPARDREAAVAAADLGAGVSYRQVDVTRRDEVRALVAEIVARHGRLDGIVHGAGIHRDGFIARKSASQLREVLAPKVLGTAWLREATRGLRLDFFVLFSSTVGALGNPGQADYAAANAYLDAVAAAGDDEGILAINWPHWKDGGMKLDAVGGRLLAHHTGMASIETPAALAALLRCLALGERRLMVMHGDLPRLRGFLARGSFDAPPAAPPAAAAGAPEVAAIDPRRVHAYLKQLLARTLQLPAHRFRSDQPLESLGMDSVMVMEMTHELEEVFGALSKTLLYEYQDVEELGAYFLAHHRDRLRAVLGGEREQAAAAPQRSPATPAPAPPPTPAPRAVPRPAPDPSRGEGVAIVGLAGRYPGAVDLDALWRNLREGRSCITEVPPERWEWRDDGGGGSRDGAAAAERGGFLDDVDKFDPLFFNISPRDAKLMDPQERLFLEVVWTALEDAGHRRQDLPAQVGVYAGAMYSDYQMLGVEAGRRGQVTPALSVHASIANRVSYLLDVQGPSMTLDTMCSSSLTAIDLACADLRRGRIELGIAGGVNVTIHPNKYVLLDDARFLSARGQCSSFGRDGDGYVPGEGVGAVILKRLADAERDGDHVYGVIRGTWVNHGGRTNGYSVPNPRAQEELIAAALESAGVNARAVSYVEAHATGTQLGDPIEVTALAKAFARHTSDTGFCFIGSVKSNLGHCESAAGIAGLTKVLLQLRAGEIAPSLHAADLNPNIDFERTPFVVNRQLRPWDRPVVDGRVLPRLAGVSSLGAGGSNAHLVIEEHLVERDLAEDGLDRRQGSAEGQAPAGPQAIVLSARDEERLLAYVGDWIAFLERRGDGGREPLELQDVAFTLAAGREAMEERLGLVVASVDELVTRLRAFRDGGGESGEAGVFRGRVRPAGDDLALLARDAEMGQVVARWIAARRFDELLTVWLQGYPVDWKAIHAEAPTAEATPSRRPRRISAPTYPFARQRCWIDLPPVAPGGDAPTGPTQPARAHELSWLVVEEGWRRRELVGGGGNGANGSNGANGANGANAAGGAGHAALAALAALAGRRIAIVADEAAEREALKAILEQLQESAGLAPPLVVRAHPTREIAEQGPHWGGADGPLWGGADGLAEAPDVVLMLGPRAPRRDAAVAAEGRDPLDPLGTEVAAVFQLSRSLMLAAWAKPVRCYYLFDRSRHAPRPECEALSGFLASAMLENDRHRWVLIGHASETEGDPSSRARLLVREWLAGLDHSDLAHPDLAHPVDASGPVEVRVDGSARFVRGMQAAAPPSLSRPVFRAGATYLVAGGLGPLGERLCLQLARRYRPTLVLVSRRPRDERIDERCRTLESAGARVLYLTADVADAAALRQALGAVAGDVGDLHGVFHLARLVEDGPILGKDWESFRRVCRAKVQGTLALDEVTAAQPLDFFVLFSSMAAWGMRGSADYAYASAFQNAFAANRRELERDGRRRGVTVAQCWGYWDVDTYGPGNRDQLARAAGFELIDMESGFPMVEASCLAASPAVGMMAVGDADKVRRRLGLAEPGLVERIAAWEHRVRQGAVMTPADLALLVRIEQLRQLPDELVDRLHALIEPLSQLGERAPPLPAPPAADDEPQAGVTAVSDVVRAALAEVMHLHQVDPHTPFPSYGLDSVSAMRLAMFLGKKLERQVLPRWLVDFPTVHALSRHLRST